MDTVVAPCRCARGSGADPTPRLYRARRPALPIKMTMDVETLERHDARVQQLIAARNDGDERWKKSFLSSLAVLKKEAEESKNSIRVRSENMPLRTFEYREARRKEAIADICDALVSENGWDGKIRAAVGKTAASLGCKF